MIRLVLSAMLLALASYEPVYADELTLIIRQPDVAIQQIVADPLTVSAPMPAADVVFDTDPFHLCEYSHQPDPIASSPLMMLSGAGWLQTIQPLKNGVVQDYTGKIFRLEYVPTVACNVYVTMRTWWTDTYTNGALTSTWVNQGPYHNNIPYGFLRATDPAWISMGNPVWRTNQPPVATTGNTTNGSRSWWLDGAFIVNSADFPLAIPLPATVSVTATRLTVTLPTAVSEELAGCPGTMALHIDDPATGTAIGMIPLPLSLYPTVSRNKPYTPDQTPSANSCVCDSALVQSSGLQSCPAVMCL